MDIVENGNHTISSTPSHALPKSSARSRRQLTQPFDADVVTQSTKAQSNTGDAVDSNTHSGHRRSSTASVNNNVKHTDNDDDDGMTKNKNNNKGLNNKRRRGHDDDGGSWHPADVDEIAAVVAVTKTTMRDKNDDDSGSMGVRRRRLNANYVESA